VALPFDADEFQSQKTANSLSRGDHLRTRQAGSADDGLHIDAIQQRQKQEKTG